ncbi:hypothetical protein ABFS82_07G077400 [Erythranthe guttata]|uniref:Cystatin domain-containing protein n=1 Tax=Erythranthe guttata TaxID=4155 RepID=A0A022QAL0_ERYGU|nr:PREDICTED: cysteine proteinase inhibitor B-like [Erythranthe guttata]EYU24293.1 hypothetical protein MIMGU_mgv1a016063mg [Erythranthe guttata]|eukprot:XP_012853126.1 PREDICTED: cysteine proteinase inhibitor B-like [Erythranthe guttata]
MAKHTAAVLILLPLLVMAVFTTQPAAAIGGKVGGRTEVKNVKANKDVQDLGRYCVQEYNRQLQQKANGTKLLVFSQVVAAETQVVSGIKYYLKISAATRGGGPAKNFEAVIVVKPWIHSKELVNFAPSTPPRDTK